MIFYSFICFALYAVQSLSTQYKRGGRGGVKAILWTACCCQKLSKFTVLYISNKLVTCLSAACACSRGRIFSIISLLGTGGSKGSPPHSGHNCRSRQQLKQNVCPLVQNFLNKNSELVNSGHTSYINGGRFFQ